MLKFLFQRLVVLLAALLVVSILAFLIPYVSGPEPAQMIMHARVSDLAVDPDTIAALRVQLGLDRPLAVQYLDWLGNAIRGDFGFTFTDRLPVSVHIKYAFVVSITLALSALILALVVALPLGAIAALKPAGKFDNAITFLTQILVAIPEYWLAPMATLVFAVYLQWLPSAGWSGPEHVILPALALALRPMAYFTRVMRASMIDVLEAPYITAALSRGLGLGQTIRRHCGGNARTPVITLFAMWLSGLIGGAVVIEVIFSIPGMGRLLYEAVVNKDLPVLQGTIMCLVSFAVLMSTITDFIYVLINPAVRIKDASA